MVLAKTGHSTYSEGHNLVFRSFVLKEGSIKSIRERCISLLARCLSSNNLRVSLRAVESLENALLEPIGAFDHEILDDDREQWRSEQLEILDHIAGLASRSTEPVTLLRIREALWWHRTYSPSNDIKGKADAIASSIPESFELRLTQELMDPFHSRDLLAEEREGDDGYRRHQERIEQTQRALVAEILSHSGDAGRAYETLIDRLRTMNDARVQPQPEVVLGILGDSDPEFAAGLCDIIVDDPNGALAPHLQPLLSHVRIRNPERARNIIPIERN